MCTCTCMSLYIWEFPIDQAGHRGLRTGVVSEMLLLIVFRSVSRVVSFCSRRPLVFVLLGLGPVYAALIPFALFFVLVCFTLFHFALSGSTMFISICFDSSCSTLSWFPSYSCICIALFCFFHLVRPWSVLCSVDFCLDPFHLLLCLALRCGAMCDRMPVLSAGIAPALESFALAFAFGYGINASLQHRSVCCLFALRVDCLRLILSLVAVHVIVVVIV